MISLIFQSLAETGLKSAGFYITRPTYSKRTIPIAEINVRFIAVLSRVGY